MDTEKIRKDFTHYMYAGHGFAFTLLKGNEEKLRDIVLYGCLNDISFDLQCEGTRGFYMHKITEMYDDPDYFFDAACEKFRADDDDINCDGRTFSHLCDFIISFSVENVNDPARGVIEYKYSRLIDIVMNSRYSRRIHDILENIEYLMITISNYGDFERTVRLCGDIGAYFLRRRKVHDEDLYPGFSWFISHITDIFDSDPVLGKGFVRKELERRSETSKELKRFCRVMYTAVEKSERENGKECKSAEEISEKADNKTLTGRDKLIFAAKSDRSEKTKLAEAALAEENTEKKITLLKVFENRRCPFPLDPEPLFGYIRAGSASLRDTALQVLSVMHSDKVRNFALDEIRSCREELSPDFLEILLNNYTDADKELLLEKLYSLDVDPESSSYIEGWHGACLTILNSDNIKDIPDEFFIWIYDRSLCSCCRESAVDELYERGKLTERMIGECLLDCNSDIKEIAEKAIDQCVRNNERREF